MKRRLKFVIAGIILVSALGYIGYKGFASSASYYYELDEVSQDTTEYQDKTLRLFGQVSPGTIEQKGLNLKFILTDGTRNLPVSYQGAVPDTFKAGADVVVEGKFGDGWTFLASTVLPKCPSKYVPAPS